VEDVVRRMDLAGLSLAVAIGVLVGVQPAINGRLGHFTGNPALAALLSTLTSTACLLIYCLILRPDLPAFSMLRTGPWWMWTGGIIGAVYVAVSLNLVQRLGATVLVAVVLVGQMIAALVVDHYGLFGLSESPLTIQRVAGVVLLIAGLALIRLY
jgi:transporter family-2 protein